MVRDRDDAFAWDGDDDPTLDARATPIAEEPDGDETVSPASLPEGWSAVGRGSEQVETTAVDAGESVPPAADGHGGAGVASAEPPAAMGNAALLATGILAGVYLLYAIGWLVGGLRLREVAQFLVSDAAYVIALWLAVAAPVVWFGATWLLTRSSRPWVRYVWLGAGVLLLIPWPFVMMGAVGR